MMTIFSKPFLRRLRFSTFIHQQNHLKPLQNLHLWHMSALCVARKRSFSEAKNSPNHLLYISFMCYYNFKLHAHLPVLQRFQF